MAHQRADCVRDDEPHESYETCKAHCATRKCGGRHQRDKARASDIEAQRVCLMLAQREQVELRALQQAEHQHRADRAAGDDELVQFDAGQAADQESGGSHVGVRIHDEDRVHACSEDRRERHAGEHDGEA